MRRKKGVLGWYQITGVGDVQRLVGEPVHHRRTEHTVQARVLVELLQHPGLAQGLPGQHALVRAALHRLALPAAGGENVG